MKNYNTKPVLANILRWMVYITAFVPLVIFSQFISPFHFGKVVVFRSLVEIMAVFYLILILRDRRWLPPKHILLGIFGLLTVMFGITTIFSVNPHLSFWGSLERMGGFWTFTHYLIYFVILTSVFREKKEWMNLLRLSIFVGFLSAIYGFGQKTNIEFFIGSGNRARIFGTIGNAALFAGYQIVVLFLALSLALSSWVNQKEKNFLLIAAFISTIAVFMTAVRGSILGVGAAFLLFAVLYLMVFRSHLARKMVTSILAVIVLYVFFVMAFGDSNLVKGSSYLTRLTDVSFKTQTVQTRFWAWQAGIEGWKENPKTILLGWGPENFNVPFSKYFNPKFFQGLGSETLFDRAHNMFVEVLVTMGLLTFLAYVAMFVLAVRSIWNRAIKNTEDRSQKIMGIGLISLILAYMIHNAFIFDTSANFIIFFTALGFIVWLTPQPGGQNHKSQITNNKQISNSKNQIVKLRLGAGLQMLMLALLVGAGVLIYKTSIAQSKANYATTRAIIASWSGDFGGAVDKFKESLNYNVPGKYEYRHRFAQYILERTNNKAPDEKEKEVILFAMQEVQKNADESNEDYLPYLYMSRLNIVLGKEGADSPYNDEALKNSMKALEISPTFVRTYYEIGQAYLNKKDSEKAIEYFKKAVELNPDVALTHWYLSASYFDSGDNDKGFAELTEARRLGYSFSEGDILRLINLYIKLNDYNKIAELYEALIGFKPGNAQYWASLAAAYAKIGRIDDAVTAARKAAEVNPKDYAGEAELFIKSLGR